MIIIQGNNVLCANCDAAHPLITQPRMCDACTAPIEGWDAAQAKIGMGRSWEEVMNEDLYAGMIVTSAGVEFERVCAPNPITPVEATVKREVPNTPTVVDLFKWGA